VLGPRRGSLAAASRYCRPSATTPDPLEDPDGFLEAVISAAHRWGCDALLPITEKSLRVILPNRSGLPNVIIPFPEAPVFADVSDKSNVLRVARSIGLHVPEQWEIQDRHDDRVSSIPGSRFPLVVKPTRSVTGLGAPSRQLGAEYASNLEELRSLLEIIPPSAFPVLVQERIVGDGAGVFLLTWAGELRAVVGHRRIRQKPPSGGVSVVRESTTVDPGLLDQSLGLLSALGWKDGVAMVEYKIQAGTSAPYLMEINGRFWGSLQLAIDAGVDFPTLLLRCARGEVPNHPIIGVPGVTTRWLLGDLDQLLLRLFKGRKDLDLLDSEPGRIGSLMRFLRDFRPGVRLEVLRFSDLGPFGTESAAWVRSLVRKGKRG
jgi:predicted ATP-grasp superfamily ATP-dependent carboligase